MSPELNDTLRALVRFLDAEKRHNPSRDTRDAIQAVINAIAQTLMELREPR